MRMVLQVKKTQYGDFNATYDEFDSRFEVLEFKVNAMEREMESLRMWEAEKSEMIMTMKTLEKELKSKLDKELRTLRKFADYLKENFQCFICKCILPIESVVLPCYNNIRCYKYCIDQWLTDHMTCPHCCATMDIQSCMMLPPACQFESMISHINEYSNETQSLNSIE